MDLFDLDADARATVAKACKDQGLDSSYGAFVAQHLDAADDSWRWCCGSNCDPCVHQLGRAVDSARQALCMPPPALPKPFDPQ